MSRHLAILRKAKLDAEMLGSVAPLRHGEATGRGGTAAAPALADPAQSRDQLQQLVHQLFLRRGPVARYALGLVSATAGEGTSYVAFSLTAELARSTAHPALLLEANMYRPSQAERLGVEPHPGLRQILLDPKLPIEQCLRQTAIQHLWLLPAGPAGSSFGGAPDWTGFRKIFQALRERFAAIVADLPPINLSTDAQIVSALFDGVALVVQADLCSREVIQNSVARLRRANPNVMGTILNRRKFFIPAPIYRRL
ncbi:MAG: CpsD/CapB family tyrosine-protein kinase [Acidobacteria bacterium]|nr:CpsD/CapB family tyrosine-protein kinase [Acidobacteriota bacterium]